MRTAQIAYRIVTKLAEKHNFDMSVIGARLGLDIPNGNRLLIERTAKYQVSVTHLVQQGDAWIAKSVIVFFCGYGDPQHAGQALWVPIQIESNRVAELNNDGTQIEYACVQAQAAAADQANNLGRMIRDQEGWLERSVVLN